MKGKMITCIATLWILTASISLASAMDQFNFKMEASVGDLLTALSILGSALAFLWSWSGNRNQIKEEHMKEYADDIRSSASMIIAKLDRRNELSLQLIEEIQPVLEKSNNCLEKNQDIEKVYEILWKGIINVLPNTNKKITDEQIEIAYKDLYGYQPEIEKFFVDTLNQLKYIDRRISQVLLQLTEGDVLYIEKHTEKPYKGNELGDTLRRTSGMIRLLYYGLMDQAVAPFHESMINLIRKEDEDIFYKNVELSRGDTGKTTEADSNALKGLNFCYLKKYDFSLKCFCSAISLNPSVAGYWAGKFLVLRALDRNTEAFDAFQKAIELIPGGPRNPTVPC